MAETAQGVSLVRWDSYVGSSAGHWLIKEVPWLAITGGPATGYCEWYLEALKKDCAGSYWGRRDEIGFGAKTIQSLIKAWQTSESLDAWLLLKEHPHLKAGFSSRFEALFELSRALRL